MIKTLVMNCEEFNDVRKEFNAVKGACVLSGDIPPLLGVDEIRVECVKEELVKKQDGVELVDIVACSFKNKVVGNKDDVVNFVTRNDLAPLDRVDYIKSLFVAWRCPMDISIDMSSVKYSFYNEISKGETVTMHEVERKFILTIKGFKWIGKENPTDSELSTEENWEKCCRR